MMMKSKNETFAVMGLSYVLYSGIPTLPIALAKAKHKLENSDYKKSKIKHN